ncbi:FAD-dependent monooxygenase [Pseudonocardia asaccharolytica]|uniref:3-(3-hydroxyphenyl)propionate hydroxylase n=1 Tax=Pseudonocardia asaccharolytica DSM 44247 = NBRC 16224 TaxID=1123024 RepID=A0A511D749_9PSEU|nr:FAD-dependent monooxygenase [Pseudonocardia asaccharolytica]GEL18788.1 3-(3-hydroxyphenyl)propionate hydroxylase [Pseudonocardia asaccharolytica DSM 44247 = NBRC 16224]
MVETDVLVVGAGPIGLTLAAELRRRGVNCRIIDRLAAPLPYAKAIGIQPRTLEIWESMGLLREALDAATPLLGQLIFVNGEQVGRIVLEVPPEVPFGFVALPQYATERVLTEHLDGLGVSVERGVELTGFEADADGVTATLTGPSGEWPVRARYLVGCDGAHSIVRKGAGLAFTGDAFVEEYMLGDVEVGWKLPPGFSIRATHTTGGRVDDVLVCIPLPGRGRYRMSMLAPPELATPAAGGDEVAHGLEGGRAPQLADLQRVLDRLAPEPTTASNLRWSSVFRISHRIVDRYREGRVFVAGDAAHIHPPTGAQGMNTGIQDAYNLGWKLALAVAGIGADGLLDSYDAERRPIGEEVVGRTVRHARTGIDADPDDPRTILLREAQLLVNYRGGPLGYDLDSAEKALRAGDRAPDVRGLCRPGVEFGLRLFELLRGPRHTLLCYAGTADDAAGLDELAETARRHAHGRLDAYAVLAPEADPSGLLLPAVRDADGEFRAAYGPGIVLVRPDGYLGYRSGPAVPGEQRSGLLAAMARTFAAPIGD